jgi:cysteine-rich repeat protein
MNALYAPELAGGGHAQKREEVMISLRLCASAVRFFFGLRAEVVSSSRVEKTLRRPRVVRLRCAVVGLAAILLHSGTAAAHVQPIPIADWGGFEPDTVTCLRTISRATLTCFDTALLALQTCNDAVVRGEACDMEETDEIVAEASRQQRLALTRTCSQSELEDLGYVGLSDSQADMFNACVTQARGAVSATYTPALTGPPTQAAAECMVASAAYARKVIRFALQQETPVMDRIAVRSLSTDEKLASIQRIEEALGAARARWVAGLLERCPDFLAVYGRSADSFLRTMKQRSDCALSNLYVHTAIDCPSQICGNGIPEGIEECDDGNRNNEDTCRTDCSANPPPP